MTGMYELIMVLATVNRYRQNCTTWTNAFLENINISTNTDSKWQPYCYLYSIGYPVFVWTIRIMIIVVVTSNAYHLSALLASIALYDLSLIEVCQMCCLVHSWCSFLAIQNGLHCNSNLKANYMYFNKFIDLTEMK